MFRLLNVRRLITRAVHMQTINGSSANIHKDSLVVRFPHLFSELHSSKNGDIEISKIHAGAHRSVWWRCSKNQDHVWKANVYDRTGRHKSGCPFCSGNRVTSSNCLKNRNPKVAGQFHPSKNGQLTPSRIHVSSSKRVWWQCEAETSHVWIAAVYSRTGKQPRGCPRCSSKHVNSKNCLASVNPKITSELHPTLNGDLNPTNIHSGSNKPVWWQCPQSDKHVWRATPGNRDILKRGCPFCKGRRVVFEESIAAKYPKIAEQFHPKLNNTQSASELSPISTRAVWWQCSSLKSWHIWKERVCNMINKQSECPHCSDESPTRYNSLAARRPDIAAEFDPVLNAPLTSAQIYYMSGKSVWWRCAAEPTHQWQDKPVSRAGRESGCPFCSGVRVSSENGTHISSENGTRVTSQNGTGI
eukprot:915457_1